MGKTIGLLLLIVFMIGCEEQVQQDFTLEDSKEIATLFILNSPTYQYNGNNLQLIDSKTLRCENCYIFIFKFVSAYDGYGARTDKSPTEIETENVIDVIVQKGEVIQATINNEWNEILQRNIVNYELIDGNKVERIPTYYCSEPRPQVCPEENSPVCGSDKNDYKNGCSACTKKSVKWYTNGKCNLGYNQRVIKDLNQGKITKDSGPLMLVVAWSMLE